MNPDTNRFEILPEHLQLRDAIQRAFDRTECAVLDPDGKPIPKHVCVFAVGEHVVIKGYTFKVAYIGETSILFEPAGPAVEVK